MMVMIMILAGQQVRVKHYVMLVTQMMTMTVRLILMIIMILIQLYVLMMMVINVMTVPQDCIQLVL